LQVLRVVQNGVQAEFERRFDRLLEPLLLTLRFDLEQEKVRDALLERFVNMTAPLDLPYMRELALNMIEGVLAVEAKGEAGSVSGEGESLAAIDKALPDKMRSLLALVEKHLSQEVVEQRMADFEREAAKQGKIVAVRHRNPLVQAQLDDERERMRSGGENAIGKSILEDGGRRQRAQELSDSKEGEEIRAPLPFSFD